MKNKLLTLIGLAALIFASFPAVSPSSAQDKKLDPVSVRVDVFFYGAHVPLMLGITDGIYKKYGIDATAVAGRGSGTTIQTVANMSDQFGFADGATLALLSAQGLKAKQIVGVLQVGSNSIISFPDSGINKPEDLNGKTTGFTPGGAADKLFPGFAKKAGVNFSSIKGLSLDAPTRDNLFLLRKIDFDLALAAAQLPILEEKCGCKLNVMRFSDYGLNLTSNGFFTSDRMIAENPDLVRRFAAATTESIDLAVKDPAHAVDAFMQYAKNSGLSRSVVARQWDEAMKLLHTDATRNRPTGWMEANDWQSTIGLLVDYAGLAKDVVIPQMIYTNEFVPK